MLDVKKDFPIFSNHPDLIYLDSAATSQRPKAVVDSIVEFYEKDNASAARGIYTLSEASTKKYEEARQKVAQFIGGNSNEIVFTKNATEAFNILSHGILPLLQSMSKDKNEIVLSEMEHHSNLVPWQEFAKKHDYTIRFIPITKDFELDMGATQDIINNKTAIVSVTHVSNVFGTINDIEAIVKIAKQNDAISIIDAAQSVLHLNVNVKKVGCDFLAFSSHKMLGPTGVGVLYGRKELLEGIEPLLFGGGMIEEVTFTDAKWNEVPDKFEAGTQNYAEAIGLGVTVDYINKIGIENIRKHEKELVIYSLEKLKSQDVTIFSPKAEKNAGIVSFNIGSIHPHDVATILNESNIAVRAGHLCAMPLMDKLGVSGVCRASFSVYNTKEDVDALIKGITKVKEVFEK